MELNKYLHGIKQIFSIKKNDENTFSYELHCNYNI